MYGVLFGLVLTVLSSPKFAEAAETGNIDGESIELVNDHLTTAQIMPRGGYIAKNHRQTNFRITSDWYYVYTQTIGKFWATKIDNVFHRNVSYTAQYDLYDQYSGRFIRTVTQNVNTKQEQWRLTY